MSRALALAAALAVLPTAALAQTTKVESAHRSLGFRLGGVTAVGNAAGETRTVIGGGMYMMFDIPDLLAEVSADVYTGESRSRMIQAGLGAYIPLADGETIPYFGGGLKLGWSRFGGDGTWGLQPFLGVGALVGRSWSPHIRVDVQWFYTTGTERRTPDAPSRHAHGPMFLFGIGF